ncbi:unnamed protein product [Ostreobium quekettii]|uniref:DNA topoisomerase VI subunit B transducer domain-containing protein n=1 Tax=Ostreobium quekettii TaxID=121088 RepID=A0A8S1JAF1_9CHLO|nr:unnamed protein product [Ostreobium quekettii]
MPENWNEPNVHKVELVDNADGWHGVDVSVTIEGDWNKCRAKVLNYLRQIAVITPYAKFTFTYLSLAGKGNVSKVYRRRTDVMPRLPKEMKYHPSSVDLELIKNLIAHTKQTTVEAFLHKDFDCIDKEYARRLIEEMRGGVDPDTSPQELTNKHIIRIHQILHQARFPDPTGAHLSPAGEYNIRLGVMKEIQPDLVATYQGDVRVFEGHAFIVEAAVSCGGNINPGINIHRYANRIPLLFEAGADVITRTALKRINWKSYKINQTGDKVGVFVSIVSTKIPFKGVGKEHIGDDIEEMVHAVKQALQHCCIQLKGKITRAIAISEQSHRKRNLAKYIPDAINSIYSVLESMADHKPYGPKRQRLEEKHNLPQEIKNRAVTKEAMLKKLTEHVERIDTDMALEYQMQVGLTQGGREKLHLTPLGAQHEHQQAIHAPLCVIKLLQ